MECVFVTGANGLLGTNIVLNLLEQNYTVKALVRNKSKFISYTHPDLELVTGDVSDFSSLEMHAAGCDYIIHAAANTSQKLLRATDYDPVNYYGTKNIIDISRKNNVKRLIYIGTANTFGYGSKNVPGDEDTPVRPPFNRSYYARSKIKTQELIDRSSAKLDIVTISPTFMIGAYDTKPSSGKIILMAAGKKILFYPPGGKNFVHVKDVADVAIKALKKGKRGERYIVSNENLSYKEFFRKVIAAMNRKVIMIRTPKIILYLIGLTGGLLRSFGIKTDISLTNMRILTIRNFYTNRKVKREFNMDFIPVDLAVLDAVNWFAAENQINDCE